MIIALDQTNFNFLLANARSGKALGLSSFLHLDQPIALWNYIRIANEIKQQLPANSKLLDWGCGFGQMTYLLRQRSFIVTPMMYAPWRIVYRIFPSAAT